MEFCGIHELLKRRQGAEVMAQGEHVLQGHNFGSNS